MWYPSHGRARVPARQRGYDQKWQQATQAFRQRNPYCLGCMAMGRSTRTELVDHVVPHRGNRVLFWDRSNWQPSCHWHHNAIKPALELMFQQGQIAAADLRLSSARAVALSREKHRPTIGVDGWAIPGS